MFDQIASKAFISVLDPLLSYQEPLSPHIVIDKNNKTDSVTLHINNVREDDEGQYKIRYVDSGGNVLAELAMNLTVLDPPSNISASSDLNITAPANLTLNCSANGKPEPTITWTRLSDNTEVTMPLSITGRQDEGDYRCTAANGVGTPLTEDVSIIVLYPAQASGCRADVSIPEGSTTLFSCPVDGNPEPTITWYIGSEAGGPVISNKKQLEAGESGCYTCSASNSLGTPVTVTQCLRIERMETIQRIALTITNMDCNNFSEQDFRKEVNEALQPFELNSIEMETRCGSVIVDLTLRFLQSVAANQIRSALAAAARQNKFGKFIVDPSSIKELVSTEMSSAAPTSTRITKECQCTCGTTLLVIIGVLVFIIILLILVIVWQHRKLGVARKKRPYKVAEDRRIYDNEVATEELNPTNDPPSSSNQQLRIPIELAYMPLQGTTHYDVGPSSPNNSAQNVEYAPLDIRTRSWEVTREDVKVEKIIGKGAFGQVAKGTARNLPLHSGTKTVAVKMLKANAPGSDKRDLKSELDLMKTLKPHPHVIKLLGCVTETDPLLVLIEYVPYGDLLGYLRKSRGLNDTYYKDPDIKPQTSLTSQQLMKFAWQIADGMSYLSLRKIIHRDLAARNVLVGEKETCKVTDFGMARDVQQENIYERKTRGRLPVKWTAYESLLYGKCTTKSDV
ncbi:fibroblast growth factor receptor 3-like [Montipora foliosa]|uniref:fibroblast growth factor receptor 3-like n=1 Tax=Montipora foliosa TaxID=591990 RepID=UPI0035F1552D